MQDRPKGWHKEERQKEKEEKKKQEEIRQAAANRMQAQNRAAGTGGYQAGYDRDFMEGPKGGGRGNNPGDKGGSDTMGSS